MSTSFPIPADDPRERSYEASAGQISFNVPFPFQRDEDVAVFRAVANVEAPLLLNIDYAVTGAGDPSGGAVALVSPAAAGDVVRILGLATEGRVTNVTTGGFYDPAQLDKELDRGAIRDRELRRDVDSVRADLSMIDGTLAEQASAQAKLYRDQTQALTVGMQELHDETEELNAETVELRDETEDFNESAGVFAGQAV